MSDPSEAHHNQAWAAYQDCDHATEFMVCDDCVAKAIAAAEERGRRRGVEELSDARALLVEIRHELLRVDGGSPESIAELPESLRRASTLARLSAAINALDAALAPRDSDVACRHECQCGYRIIGRDERLHTYDAVHTWSKCEAAETPTAWKKPESGEELWALLREVETTLAGRREIEGASPATVSAIVAKLAAYAVHHPSLAPRDSGKEPVRDSDDDLRALGERWTGKDRK